MSPHDYATPTPHGFVGARHRQGLTEQIAPAIEHEARNLRIEAWLRIGAASLDDVAVLDKEGNSLLVTMQARH